MRSWHRALGLRTMFRSFKVQLLDPNITVGADQKSAIVDLTLRAETPGDQYLVVQEIKCTLRQVDGEWIILRVDTVRTLNRAPTPRSREAPALHMNEPALAHLRRADKVLARVIKQVGPCPLAPRRGVPPYQALVKSVTYQQLNGKAAETIFRRLLALFPGTKFPAPEDHCRRPG